MKKTIKLVSLLIALCMVMTFVLVACNNNDEEDGVRESIDLADYKDYVKADLLAVKNSIGSVSSSVDAQVTAAFNEGNSNIDAAASVKAVQTAFSSAKAKMANCVPYANGTFDLSGMKPAEYEKVLGILESYAVRTGLTGTSLFNNGGYVKYHSRVKLGTETYIPGYGFATLEAGELTADLASESNSAWKRYYHNATSSDPASINYLNDQKDTTGTYYGYIAASYYTLFMNETGDGYEWHPELAAGDLIPIGADENGKTTTWKFEVRQGLKYNTLGSRTAFNNRPVALEDFITGYKLLLNQGNGYYRGGEMANNTDNSSIKGIDAYYKATKDSAKGILEDTDELSFADMVSIKVYKENEGTADEKWWFEFELNGKQNEFYARYYISSSLVMPIPADFIKEVGVENYLGFSSDKSTSPVDNSLSLGAYTLERWDSGQLIVYKKNPNYVYSSTKYQIAGIHTNIVPGAKTDEEAIWKEFEAGKLDAASIPSTQFAAHRNDEGVKVTVGSNFALNMNALDQETWIKLFGVNGSVTQTPENKYWEVKPAMSNAHFRSALGYALDRISLADSLNCTPSIDFFDPDYLSDAEAGVSYNSTDTHKSVVSSLVRGTDGYGYSLELAKDYFRMALDELEADGLYSPGTKSNPTVIKLQIAWQYPQDEGTYHNFVKQCWEEAFNDESVSGGLYKLEIEFWVGTEWSDVYFEKMMVGQFDIGMGSVGGNTFDPISYLEVLSVDPLINDGFCLNWGVDTSDPDAEILVYNGFRWSFDALVEASLKPTIVVDGRISSQIVVDCDIEVSEDEDPEVTAVFTISWADGVTINFEELDFVIFGFSKADYSDYDEWSILYDEEYENYSEFLVGEPVIDEEARTAKFTFKFKVSDLGDLPTAVLGIDLYIGWDFQGSEVATDCYNSYYIELGE